MLSIFSCACWPSLCLLWRNFCLGLVPFFDWIVWFLVVWAVYVVWELSPYWSHNLQIFFPILWVVCPFCSWFPLGFPCGSASKESTSSVGDLGLIPGLGRSPGEGKGYPLQYSGQENSVDFIVHGVSQSLTQLNDFHFHWNFLVQIVKSLSAMWETWVQSLGWEDPLEMEMATHSSTLA